jgi:hypothetical protein
MRHAFLVLLAALVFGLPGLCFSQEKAAAPESLAALRAKRQAAAHRPRRIIFNNDGDDVIYTKKEPTAEALLALRTAPLVGSQVDSIFYSNSLCFGDALHNSKVMEPFMCTEYIFKDSGLPQLLARNLDPIQIMADFCHKHNIEIFWDMRMNDTHDAMIGGYGPYLRPKFKLDHPEYLCGTAERQPKCGTWTSVDFAQPEVRDLAFRFFEEVCNKFDIDGIELDFLRHACFFKSVANGGTASPAELDMMTDLVRKTRRMTEEAGLKRGRPILIAIRVPDSVEYCKGIGLDVEKWLAEGLVDVLSGSCYFQLNPWPYLIELGHKYGVPVYPCLSESRVKGETRFSRQSPESYRARAMRAWFQGADGIYVFNYFNPRGPIWRELGDPKALRTMNKLYFVTVRDGSPERYLVNGSRYHHLPILTPTRLWAVYPDKPTDVHLTVGDDVAGPQKEGWRATVTCHIRTDGPTGLLASLNGVTLAKPTVLQGWLDYPVPPELLKQGDNVLSLTAAPEQKPDEAQPQWDFVYEGPKLPGPPWIMDRQRERCTAEIKDGKLYIADRGTESGDYIFFLCYTPMRPSDEAVVEFRAKTVSGWSSVFVENGATGEEFQLFPDRVVARYCGLSYPMDTASAFHTYRITAKDKDFKVFVDGTLRLDGAGRFTGPAYNGRCVISFGAANSSSVGEAYWEYVRIRNRSKAVYDAAISIAYVKR